MNTETLTDVAIESPARNPSPLPTSIGVTASP